MYKIDFFLDKETFSQLDLTQVSNPNYAAHPSTLITRIGYTLGRNGALKLWKPLSEPIPSEIMDLALHPERYNFIAWNVFFDYLIWICVMPRYIPGLVRPPLENIHDAMALSCYFRTGASLESCSKFMDMPMGKDPEGRRAMLKSCKPDSKGKMPVLSPQEEAAFDRYAIGDVRILREAYYRLPPLPEPERFAWEWTFKRNISGIRIDLPLVMELSEIVADFMPRMEQEFESIVGAKINSHVKVKIWFQQFWPWIKDMRADTVRDMLLDFEGKPPLALRALEIKDLAGSTAISKLKTARLTSYMGRVYDVLKYCQAQTKRWSGNGIQIQNLPRVDGKRPDSLPNDLNIENLAEVVKSMRPGLKDPIGFSKNLLRRIFLPSQGKTFYCGDWAKIEPTTLFWFLGLGAIPKKWYEEMAAEIYNKRIEEIGKESEERQVGKTAQLQCGYGAGWESFQTAVFEQTGIKLTDDMAKTVVHAYRRKYPQVVQLWSDLENAFRLAIMGQTSSLCSGKVHIMPMHVIYPNWKGVAIRLPSGSHLFYHNAEEIFSEWYETEGTRRSEIIKITKEEYLLLAPIDRMKFKYKTKMVLRYKSDEGKGSVVWKYVYGGLLTENVVSGTARDILIPFLWNAQNAGFDVLGLVHDEGWAESYAGREEEYNNLMCIRPSWCRDMEIGAESNSGVRYLK